MPTRYQGTDDEVRALNLFIKLMRATETLNARLQQALSEQGLTMGQLAVLEALLHLGPMHQRNLGRKLLRSDANVTTVVDNLERDGLVTRQRAQKDKRFVTVSLTASGKRLIQKVFPAHARSIAKSLAGLTPGEQEQLSALCKKLGLSLAS
jgi:MarR family 2-MHQ and catechol resistance regulon transcriptional repressor